MRSLPQTDSARLPFVWTRGIAAREALHYLDRNGIDAEPLLSKAELSRAQLTQDPGGASAASQNRFLELAAADLDDPLLGLHVAAAMDLREIGSSILQPPPRRSPTRSTTWRNTVRRRPTKFGLRSRNGKGRPC